MVGVYVRFLFVSVCNYDEFKKDLFECFEVINEEFREKFRIFKFDGNENFF